jgi:hypothetical protein
MKSILDPTFRYTPSAKTDLRKTFARIRREQRREQVEKQAERRIESAAAVSVVPIRPRRAAAV